MHLWTSESKKSPWLPRPLNGHPVALSFDGDVLDPAPAEAPIILQPAGCDWLLLTGCKAAVSINGRAVPLGVAKLQDKDEITLASGRRLFFSTEVLSERAPFTGLPDGSPCLCARCQSVIELHRSAVRCGACGVFTHEECWVYAPICPSCPQPTSEDAGFNFDPSQL